MAQATTSSRYSSTARWSRRVALGGLLPLRSGAGRRRQPRPDGRQGPLPRKRHPRCRQYRSGIPDRQRRPQLIADADRRWRRSRRRGRSDRQEVQEAPQEACRAAAQALQEAQEAPLSRREATSAGPRHGARRRWERDIRMTLYRGNIGRHHPPRLGPSETSLRESAQGRTTRSVRTPRPQSSREAAIGSCSSCCATQRVISARGGWTGGEGENPTEEKPQGHAKAVEVVFDPERLSYRELLEYFFQVHRADLGEDLVGSITARRSSIRARSSAGWPRDDRRRRCLGPLARQDRDQDQRGSPLLGGPGRGSGPSPALSGLPGGQRAPLPAHGRGTGNRETVA